MTALTVRQSTDLTIEPDQTFWSEKQVAVLRQLGLDNVANSDLAVFFHQCTRTGLDPFARQIYMISRMQSEKDANGNWVKVNKPTIQTGIDGYRLVARRAADRAHQTLEYEDTLWCGSDGQWSDVWVQDTPPAAAKVTVIRSGDKFPGIATWREFVQTKRDGEPNTMWAKMPSNQLAKCAEALALRKAFPQDLSGIYTDDEMAHLDDAPVDGVAVVAAPSADPVPVRRMSRASWKTETPAPVEAEVVEEPEAVDAEVVEDDQPVDSPPLDTRSALAKRMFAGLNDAGYGGADKQRRLEYMTETVGRLITTSGDLTELEAKAIIDRTAGVQ